MYLTADSDKEMRNSLMSVWLALKPYKYPTCRPLMWAFCLVLLQLAINQAVTNLKNTNENSPDVWNFCGEGTHNVKNQYDIFTLFACS